MEGATIYRFTAEIFGEEEGNPSELYLHLNHADALKLLETHLTTPNLVKHCLAAEAVLGRVAESLEEDQPQWKLCGLLHDIDYDLTAEQPERHTLAAEEILLEQGIDGPIIEAIKGHNDLAPRESKLAKALWAVDPLTGLIVAAALISPDKKLAGIDVSFVCNRMKEKSFARAVSREKIASFEQLGSSVESFIGLGLEAMQKIAPQLGL
ncbi:MAG: HDIG domain-containing protein [Armatimonadetes bacterium]|nr:HDIG domain-containing protein [Armatimonadota bacterium]NIM22937.1 HDIG domain-containing protein [Armatimonadota bacterium]NIM66808.1 HDIG domain-containing protein [Armatimonadota bacterium]NIM75349.1 HDIG domain-containing protein [Armatimonadota bacterium]NIN04996.1 HDIG domain-containing protein [Armatimonadota bacterium]